MLVSDLQRLQDFAQCGYAIIHFSNPLWLDIQNICNSVLLLSHYQFYIFCWLENKSENYSFEMFLDGLYDLLIC